MSNKTATRPVRMLTTIDNPYNPFTHWDEWWVYDHAKGHCTCEYLARIVRTSDDLSDADQDQAIDDALDEIIRYNFIGIYKTVDEPIAEAS